MSPSEAAGVTATLAELWPEWNSTEQELSAWRNGLLAYDADVADEAVHEAWRESNYKSPPRAAIFAKLRAKTRASLVERRQLRPERAGPRYTDAWIICVEPPDRDQALLGAAHPVVLPGSWQGPVIAERVIGAARRLAREHAIIYGGTWAIARPVTPVSMIYNLRFQVRERDAATLAGLTDRISGAEAREAECEPLGDTSAPVCQPAGPDPEEVV